MKVRERLLERAWRLIHKMMVLVILGCIDFTMEFKIGLAERGIFKESPSSHKEGLIL